MYKNDHLLWAIVLAISIYITGITFVFKNFWDYLWETKVFWDQKIFLYVAVSIIVLFTIWYGKKEKLLFFFGCILGVVACVIAMLWMIGSPEILSILAGLMEKLGSILTVIAPICAAIYWFKNLPPPPK